MDQFNEDGSMNEEDFPVTTPGTVVLLQIKDASSYKGGIRQYERAEIVERTIHSVETCWLNLNEGDTQEEIDAHDVGPDYAHQVTICADCIPTWSRDYYITLGDTPHHLGLRDKI